MPGPFFNPMIFGIEFFYTLIIVLLCFLIFYKTKEMYEISKYKGIQYFRHAFLFFGLAYLARFVMHLIQLSLFAFDFFVPRNMMFPSVMIITSYFSTIAIFYLAYSTIWKKISYTNFIIGSNIIAIIISVFAFMSRSPMIVSLVQLPLIIFTLVLTFTKGHKKSHTRTLYFLIVIFWLTSLFLLEQRFRIAMEIKMALHFISLGVFGYLAYKVFKWTK